MSDDPKESQPDPLGAQISDPPPPQQQNIFHEQESLPANPHESDDPEQGHLIIWENDPTKVHFMQQAKDIRHQVTAHLAENSGVKSITINPRRSYAPFRCLDQDHVSKEGEKEISDEQGKLKYAFGLELKFDDSLPDGVLRLE